MTPGGNDWKNMVIEDAGLAPRAVRALAAAGIATLGEIEAMSDVELVRIRDLGRMQMWAVRTRIAEIGKAAAEKGEEAAPLADRVEGISTYLRELGAVLKREMSAEQLYMIGRTVGAPDRYAAIAEECAGAIRAAEDVERHEENAANG